ncbi:MAG: hypothetical protein BroJett021_45800 [Chloroflexota bacterium]|nr:hypothetical protein [Caldilinea sp.]GIK75592.1 MAG: hypothetical protein BroJett021_45800 [Chloroflexota bacterium]
MDAPNRFGLTSIQWGIVVLTLITALIHIWLGIGFLDSGGVIFVLNGAGYLSLLFLLLAPIAPLARYRSLIRWALIAYTAITIFAWLLIPTAARTPLAFFDKAVEIALVVLLWLDGQRK